ncbi:hypothetical protein [Rhodococcus sp. NCIMB 12038]|uniref:hypothetical protein n=1 Tax=Rhodococcus sp. NCIMB 12038 TaxID=933800 RepID=UPI000B3CF020|nr:hypothetical protein [Rhodococcus sp. NCIMB 12038]OUS97416.1 hypothetical protein CA951_03485 [Rhodococcus sp. NCIMB 12038]
MTTQTATVNAPTAEVAGQLALDLGLSLHAWVTEQRDIIAEWNARGDRYRTFVNAYDEDTVTAFGAYIDDLAVHLDALEDPSLTGLPSYNARDLLAELRHLRNLNENLVRADGRGIVRRAAGSPRTTIRWGLTAGDGSARVYAGVIDRTAKSLAIALKKS